MDASSFDFSVFRFAPVIDLPGPGEYEVYDFTVDSNEGRARSSVYGIGRYNEKRRGMYITELFAGDAEPRDIHVGIDIAAPAGTPVKAFYDGIIHLAGINPAAGDYGGTLITEHRLGERVIWALHGHLSHASVAGRRSGTPIQCGETIAWLGGKDENGGWNPHLHFQLSWERPERCDLPGVVSESDRARALAIYPDPRWVLGPLY